MKKLLPIITPIFVILLFFLFYLPSLSFAICIKPPDYDPATDPDINLDLLGWEPVVDSPLFDQFPFVHETDPKAPQLSTLIPGAENCDLTVTSVNMISGSDRPSTPVPDDFANLICLSTPVGASVLVPNSGYNMGGGCEAAVLYATSNSIVLKYTPDDNIVKGYTVYLNNFQVDDDLLAYYNEHRGSENAPCLSGGERIGVSSGETCVAIRDTGTFMDSRWQEWWNQCPATELELILKLINLCLGGGPPEELPPDFFPSNSLVCTPDLIGDRDSRPYYNFNCDLCNLTGLFCPSCATSFTVFDTVSWRWRDKDEECEDNVWVTREWPESPPGTIVINPSDTKIPFVGKKREVRTGRVDIEKEDEQKYLADYFEGTHEYYRRYPLSKWNIDFFHGVNPIFTTNYQGVFRKLAPMAYQDKLKKQMIERARATQVKNIHAGGVHNYELNYVRRICWHAPFWLDVLALIAGEIVEGLDPLAITHYCLYGYNTTFDNPLISAVNGILDAWNGNPLTPSFLKIPYFYQDALAQQMLALEGNYPPDPSEEDYAKKWKDWKFKNLEEKEFSDAGKLWEVLPMFSREDTPGMILPYLGSKPLDTFKIANPENQVEKVPHVARLYESTQEVQKMLIPFYEEDLLFSQNKSKPIIASAEKNVLGEKLFIAQAGSLSTGFSISLSPKGGNQYDLCWAVSGHASGGCNYCDWGYCIQPYGFCEPILPKHCWTGNPTITCNMGSAHPISITANPGDTVCATLNITSGVCGGPCCDPDPRPGFSKTACCQILEDGTSTCGTGPVEPPLCGLPGALPVDQCEMEAITDSNPNDDLCCDPINIELTAVDMFINKNYTECSDYTCGPTGTSLCPDDPCLNKETRGVNREIGITLIHPYLTNIWEQTGLADTAGLFNIFRPENEKIPKFREVDASSEIVYTQSGFDAITPSIGKFYFNYLGGVQLAKEWVTRTLMPWKE